MTLRQIVILICIFFLNFSFNKAQNSTLNNTSGLAENKTMRIVKVTVKNPIRDWEDTSKIFFGNYSDHLNVHIVLTMEECRKQRTNKIKASSDLKPEGSLSFHRKHGKDVVIQNGGKTVQKITCDVLTYEDRMSSESPLDTATFTNRPLKDNEIFEVKIEKRRSNINGRIAIGVIGISPEDIQRYRDIARWNSGDNYTCIFMSSSLFGKCGSGKLADNSNTEYGAEGETIGVMRSEFGTLHFFSNGYPFVSQITGVPSKVYGYFDLRKPGVKASIVDFIP